MMVAAVLMSCAAASSAADKEKLGDENARLAAAKAVAPALVRVEYTLQFDKGEAPQAFGWSQRCPSCGGFHGTDPESVIKEDRPFEFGGFLIAPDKVVTGDPMIHPRFIKSIAVRFVSAGDAADKAEAVPATPAAYAKEQNAVILKLERPLGGSTKPLSFDASKKGPYLAITYSQGDGEWTTGVQPASGTVGTTERRRQFISVPSYVLLTDAAGAPVGLSMRDELTIDDSWKGSPLDWPAYTAEELAKVTAQVETTVRQGLPRVTLNFRSPKARPGNEFYGRMGDEGDQNSTVRHVTGVIVDEKTVLVLAELKGNVTARLEGIRVHTPDGKSVSAKFSRTLADYGAFVATLETPMPAAVVKPAKEQDVLAFRGKLLPSAQLHVQGERRTEYFGHRRVPGFDTGWRRQLYPQVTGDANEMFLFAPDGSLFALPISRREKGSLEERFSHSRADNKLTPVAYLWPVVTGDPAKYADAGNVPLSEEQESRLAWLGVELQALTPDLARANEVSHLTNDGRSGGLVTYVYPHSPAAAAGIEPGWILLRIHVPDQPKPMEVQIEPYQFGEQAFPWDRFDELPEQYFDRIPQPWPNVENALTRALTDLGFGKKFTAEFFHDGKTDQKQFEVAESPPHFDSAAKFKLDPMGVTVKDLSYEVRRYFQRSNEEPGVILAKIEMGSKASIAGLKPYEVITHVNDQPVKDVKEFDKLTKGQETLRLTVKRMTKGRQVKVSLAGKDEKPATRPKPAIPLPAPPIGEDEE